MKRISVVFLFSIFLLNVVSASPSYGLGGGLGYGMEQLIDIVERLAWPVTEALFGSSDYMFEKVLFLVVLISVISVALNQVRIFNGKSKSEKSIRWIVTVAVSLIAVRFLVETDLVKAMMLPYGVLGVVMTSVLPFIIYFFFTLGVFPYERNTAQDKIGRKMMWIFFSVVFIGVWGSRADELGDLAWIYFFTAVATVILFLLDGTFARMSYKSRQRKRINKATREEIYDIEEKLRKVRKRLRNNPDDDNLKEDEKKLVERIKTLNDRYVT